MTISNKVKQNGNTYRVYILGDKDALREFYIYFPE